MDQLNEVPQGGDDPVILTVEERRAARSKRVKEDEFGLVAGCGLWVLFILFFYFYGPSIGRGIRLFLFDDERPAQTDAFMDQLSRLLIVQDEIERFAAFLEDQQKELLDRQVAVDALGDEYRRLEGLTSIQQGQVDALLAEQRRYARFDSYLNFALGVLSSLLAQVLWTRFSRWRVKNRPQDGAASPGHDAPPPAEA